MSTAPLVMNTPPSSRNTPMADARALQTEIDSLTERAHDARLWRTGNLVFGSLALGWVLFFTIIFIQRACST